MLSCIKLLEITYSDLTWPATCVCVDGRCLWYIFMLLINSQTNKPYVIETLRM